MSTFDFDDIVIGGPRPQETLKFPTTPNVVYVDPSSVLPKPAKQGIPGWVAGVLAFLAVTFFLLWVSTFNFVPGPGPDPDVDPVDGAYVLMVYNDADMSRYSQDQVTALQSAAIAGLLDDSVSGWKKVDKDQLAELANLNPAYARLAEIHRPRDPAIVGISGGRVLNEEIKDADQVIAFVKRLVK